MISGCRVLPIMFVMLLSAALIGPLILDVRGGDQPPNETAQIAGSQVFPPVNVTNESSFRDLSKWLNQTLGLNVTGSPIERESLYGGSFNDAFGQTISISARDWVSQAASGTTLKLHYAFPTHEFIGFDVQFVPPRYIGTPPLRDFTIEVADALGINLANASYVQHFTTYIQEGSNGTGPVTLITNIGDWRETRDSLPLNVVNQLSVWEDNASHAVSNMRAYSWFDNVPAVNFTVGEIVNAAAQAVNRTYGPRFFSSYELGVMPNYQGVTWSFIVSLFYDRSGCGGEQVILMLKMDDLEFQGINDRVVSVCDRVGFAVPYPLIFFLFGGVILISVFLGGWLSQSSGAWAATAVALLLPLYIRLKRESVLDHFMRGRIVEFVSSNPGATFSQIQSRFKATNGLLNYHLWILSKTGFIQSEKEGKFTRYYAEGTLDRANVILSSFQHSLLTFVFNEKSTDLQGIAKALSCSKQRVHYNVKRLGRLGFIEQERRGSKRFVSLSQSGMTLLKESASTVA